MRFHSSTPPLQALIAVLLAVAQLSTAVQVITSKSLNPCQGNATNTTQGFTATLFNVEFFPGNRSVDYNVIGVSTISGYITAVVDIVAYGYGVTSKQLDPCDLNLAGLCPMTPGPLNIPGNFQNISRNIINQIPSIAYSIPDLDGKVQVRVIQKGPPYHQLACLEAEMSNGKTVYQKGVGWATAVVVGLVLIVSAVVSGLGHSNTAAHVAANAMSLFGFFQTQAMFGLTAVQLPPIVAAWTQNFQWAMGIIHIHFIQSICTWYQRSTGGTPSSVLSRLSVVSISLERRSLEAVNWAASQAKTLLVPRTNRNKMTETSQTITIRGIERAGFIAGIEPTNIFMTGYIFFLIFVVFVVLGVVLFKFILEALAKSGKIKGDKFQDFRNGWTIILKGILFRLILIGFPQMVVLCFWEMTRNDSAGEMVLAIVTVASMILMLGWACIKVIFIAKRSISMHKNPAYILYSDPVSLHKWGFLYVQFKATHYWFIVPLLGFLLAEGMFVGFGQGSGTAQAIGLLILNLACLVGISILRPYMDKKTNAFNIAIAAVNFVSTIFLLFYTDVFGLPGLVVGVMGVIFFIMNAAFALILIIMVLLASGFAIFSKNPDVRYQPMRDDRGSFIKSQSNLNTELDALGATARGESKVPFKTREHDTDSYSSSSFEDRQHSGYNSMTHTYSKEGATTNISQQNTAYDSSPFAPQQYSRAQSMVSTNSVARSHNASPWQRGAGYDR